MGSGGKRKRRDPKLDDVPSIRQFEDMVRRLKVRAMRRPTIDNVLPLTVAVTGCRISECLALTTPDIDEENGVVHIPTLKGGSGARRSIPVPSWFFAVIRSYVLYNGVGYRLFNISRVQAWRIIKRATGLRPHALRHAFGMYMLFHGADPETVKRLLGHSNWKMVEYYVNKVQIDKSVKTPFEVI